MVTIDIDRDFADFDQRILMAASGSGSEYRRLDAVVAFNSRDGVIARYEVQIGPRMGYFDSLPLAVAHYNEAPIR